MRLLETVLLDGGVLKKLGLNVIEVRQEMNLDKAGRCPLGVSGKYKKKGDRQMAPSVIVKIKPGKLTLISKENKDKLWIPCSHAFLTVITLPSKRTFL